MYQYPYGNAQQLNLDWILSKLQELESGSGGGADLEEVANALVSASFDATIPYRKYDYAFYDGKLYMALNDTIGAFNPSDWMEVTLGADISVLTRLVNADSALLTTLQNKVNNLGSDDVANESTVTGNTVTDALGTLNGAISAKPTLSMFKKIGVIGDSYASGEMYYSGAYHDLYPISWVQDLARNKGISAINYSAGGFKITDFTNASDARYNTYGYGKLVSDFTNNKIGLFLIALGLNDAAADTSGTNVNTFKTNLETLIDNINTLYSNTAKIFLLTFKRNAKTSVASDDTYNTAIQQASADKLIPCIDIRNNEFFSSSAFLHFYDSSGHPMPQIYAAMSEAISFEIEKAMLTVANRPYLQDYKGIDITTHIKETGSVTFNSAMPSSAHATLTKIDNEVSLVLETGSGTINRTDIGNGWINICTLPVGFRPQEQKGAIGYYMPIVLNETVVRNYQVLTDGTVRVYWNLGTSQNVHECVVNATYTINE